MPSPTTVIKAAQSGSTTSLVYPLDLDSQPYYTSFQFQKYSRAVNTVIPTFANVGSLHLPLPLEIQQSYSLSYNNVNLGFIGNVAEYVKRNYGNRNLSDLTNAVMGAAGGNIDISVQDAVTSALAMAPSILGDNAITQTISQTLGIIPNPHLTTIFAGVGLQTRSWSWVVSPRSEAEAKALDTLQNTIKQWIHPTYSATLNKFGLDVPYTCFVNFKGAKTIEPMKRSVVTDFNVNLTGSGGPAFFKGGYIKEYFITMRLQETEIRTSDDFAGNPSTTDGSYAGGTSNSVLITPDAVIVDNTRTKDDKI